MVYGIFPLIQENQSNPQQQIKKLASLIINPDPSPSANGIIRFNKKKVEPAQYLSGACCYPVPSTFLRAIRRKHFTSGLD